MKIIIGSDHRGYELKEKIKQNFADFDWEDVGTENGLDRVDYPIFAQKICRSILAGEAEKAIVICGSGVGVSIASNRFKGIYAALCWSPEVARAAKEHDHANVLALPADFMDASEAVKIVKSWLEASFKGGRYEKRLEMLDNF